MITTDARNTYACYIYPDAASAQNPNGGVDLTTEIFGNGQTVGFDSSRGNSYRIPDSGSPTISGIDGIGKKIF